MGGLSRQRPSVELKLFRARKAPERSHMRVNCEGVFLEEMMVFCVGDKSDLDFKYTKGTQPSFPMVLTTQNLLPLKIKHENCCDKGKTAQISI